MKRYTLLLLFVLAAGVSAQVPLGVKVEIAQAEDARRYDAVLENLMKSPNTDVRARAALAAGRIGDDKAIPALVALLENDRVPEVRVTAAFAIGETESLKGADAILRLIGETARAQVPGVREPENGNRARLVEAAGKIAAANAQDPKAKDLAQAIMFTLEAELLKTTGYDKPTVLQALTAALRARPTGADATVQRFLAFTDPDIVATALNTLARLRAKNANRDARDLLATHVNAIVRANAARLLGAADDKGAVDILLNAATEDSDSRVRVSAIRAVGALKDAKGVDPLIAGTLLSRKSSFAIK
jgi:HEAT repeat protein